MAEAHQAVAFSFAISSEGVVWNVNMEALSAVWRSGLLYWSNLMHRIKNRFLNGVYPARPDSWMGMVMFIFTMAVFGMDLSFGLIDRLKPCAKSLLSLQPPHDHIVACFWFALLFWLSGVILRKLLLTKLLSYTRWMYEVRGPLSLRTKLWHMCVTALGGTHPQLYSYQGVLPKLPLPAVADTIRRYLRSITPLVSEEEYQRMEKLAKQFLQKEANRLQRYLWVKTWWAVNYVSDWWEEYVYLSSRSPIMVNSNYYCMDACLEQPTRKPAARAANVVHAMVQYMLSLQREERPPLMLNDMVPLCSAQYERQFCTTRIPAKGKDWLLHLDSASHVAVYSSGRWFRCDFRIQDTFLTPAELQALFEAVLSDTSETTDTEKYLAALTAGDREHWALARQHYFSNGVNRKSLDMIEKAAFCVIFDEEEFGEGNEALSRFGKVLLHGKCYDRWFDKSFNLVVMRDGKIGFNAEHSWADAPVMAQMWEVSLYDDSCLPQYGYDKKGNCRAYPPPVTPAPLRLRWNFPPQCLDAVQKSLNVARALADDVDLHVLVHNMYGKGFMKTCRVSPDAYIQMGLQLAYYRAAGRFCLTYEATMTRLFREGRTETMRSCSMASTEFVLAMEDKESDPETRIRLFRRACDEHQSAYRDAMTGKGVDRHLFCLYVISKYLGQESAFLHEVLSEPWRLSTSQTPHTQTGRVDHRMHPNIICTGGGFGPVADDGYGVSYIIVNEDTIFFHVSSKFSCVKTDSKRFANEIQKALADLKDLMQMKK